MRWVVGRREIKADEQRSRPGDYSQIDYHGARSNERTVAPWEKFW